MLDTHASIAGSTTTPSTPISTTSTSKAGCVSCRGAFERRASEACSEACRCVRRCVSIGTRRQAERDGGGDKLRLDWLDQLLALPQSSSSKEASQECAPGAAGGARGRSVTDSMRLGDADALFCVDALSCRLLQRPGVAHCAACLSRVLGVGCQNAETGSLSREPRQRSGAPKQPSSSCSTASPRTCRCTCRVPHPPQSPPSLQALSNGGATPPRDPGFNDIGIFECVAGTGRAWPCARATTCATTCD